MRKTISDSTKKEAANQDRQRTKQIIIASSTACIVAFMSLWALVFKPVWPMAVGVASVAAMVAIVSYVVLTRRS
jgi:hypothetical protein